MSEQVSKEAAKNIYDNLISSLPQGRETFINQASGIIDTALAASKAEIKNLKQLYFDLRDTIGGVSDDPFVNIRELHKALAASKEREQPDSGERDRKDRALQEQADIIARLHQQLSASKERVEELERDLKLSHEAYRRRGQEKLTITQELLASKEREAATWIKTSERAPEEGDTDGNKQVIFLDRRGFADVMHYSKADDTEIWPYWMRIPALPDSTGATQSEGSVFHSKKSASVGATAEKGVND